jgi:hypothetical protein|tara:strand:- start:1990 stop:2115 length:126 start_codon:yes stop_codon:yes gene_type:complete
MKMFLFFNSVLVLAILVAVLLAAQTLVSQLLEVTYNFLGAL